MNETMLIDMVFTNGIDFFFGHLWMMTVLLLIIMMIILVSSGMDFNKSLLIIFPIIMAINYIGYFSHVSWVVHLLMIFVGIVYGWAITNLFIK